MTELTETQKQCINCQECCRINLVPINPDNRTLELYYTKGIPLVYHGASRYWSIYLNVPCPHLTPDGCDIYDDPKKPELCGRYHCKVGAEKFRSDIEQQREESQQILALMFEGENNNGDDLGESD